MIINIRGTGGSGKSTVVTKLMALATDVTPERVDGRARPLTYSMRTPSGQTLRVLGHYETPCGGCDTIKTPDHVFQLIERGHQSGEHVLFEGIIVMDDVRRICELHHRTKQVAIIVLTTPIADCLKAIETRRAERGDERELNPTNTVKRAERMEQNLRKIRGQGVPVTRCTREQALAECQRAFGWAL